MSDKIRPQHLARKAMRILRRLSWLNVDQLNLPLEARRQKMPTGHLRAVVPSIHVVIAGQSPWSECVCRNSFRKEIPSYDRVHFYHEGLHLGSHRCGQDVLRDPSTPDLRRKAYTAVAAKMARVAYALIKAGIDYRRFHEAAIPGRRIPSRRAVKA